MPKPFSERLKLAEATTSADRKSGRMVIQVMSPGWGSSGYYSPEVCEAAASLMPAGTQMFLDHQHQDGSGLDERGNRSLRDLAAVFTSDARWDATAQAVVAESQVTAPYREFLCDEYVAPHIGLSLNGAASDITIGEAEGRQGPIIESIAAVNSVDYVTRAGRGGMVMEVLESGLPAMVVSRALGRGVSEATVNDTREALQTILRDTYGAEKTYVWVRDFDETTVWFEVESGEDSGCYGQAYTSTDGAIELTGDRTEVRVSTTYVPVRPGGSTTTEESQEDTMPETRIEESELRTLREDAGRLPAVETERDTAVTERDQLRRERDTLLAREAAVTHARTRVTEANAALPAATVDRIVAQATATVTLTEAGQLDTAALDTAVDTARTAEETYLAGLAEAAGIGSITGFGGAPAGDQPALTEAHIDAAVGGAFGRQVKEA